QPDQHININFYVSRKTKKDKAVMILALSFMC
ncbi:hypothetical protein P578_02652, partial [Staphylococcus aureus M1443]